MGWFWNSDSDKNENKTENSENNIVPNQESHTTFHSYSSSRSCFSDPENSEYLICKQKIKDGKNQTVKQTRVKASDQMPFSNLVNHTLFNPFFGQSLANGFNESQKIINQRLSNLDIQLQQDFGNIFNAFMPFFMTVDPQGFQKQFKDNSRKFQNSYSQTKNKKEEQSNYNNNHYYSSDYRDTEIRDL